MKKYVLVHPRGDGLAYMEECDEGAYVLFEDVQLEREALKKAMCANCYIAWEEAEKATQPSALPTEAAPVNSYSIDREIERRKRLTDGDSEEYDEGI